MKSLILLSGLLVFSPLSFAGTCETYEDVDQVRSFSVVTNGGSLIFIPQGEPTNLSEIERLPKKSDFNPRHI